MIVTALEHMSAEDRQLGEFVLKKIKLVKLIKVEKHYGKSGVDDVAAIKDLYTRLDMSTIFAQFEEASYTRIEELINTYRFVRFHY